MWKVKDEVDSWGIEHTVSKTFAIAIQWLCTFFSNYNIMLIKPVSTNVTLVSLRLTLPPNSSGAVGSRRGKLWFQTHPVPGPGQNPCGRLTQFSETLPGVNLEQWGPDWNNEREENKTSRRYLSLSCVRKPGILARGSEVSLETTGLELLLHI